MNTNGCWANDESDNEATDQDQAELLDHATNNLLRAVKRKILKKKAAWITTNCAKKVTVIDCWQKSKRFELLHSIFRRRINSITVRSSKGAARFAYFKASE